LIFFPVHLTSSHGQARGVKSVATPFALYRGSDDSGQ